MTIFWIVTALACIYWYLSKNEQKNDRTIMISILAAAFLIIAIITKDPIFTTFGVPAEFEWVVGIFITCLSSWKLYFSPLKERVVKLEKKVVVIESHLANIKNDLIIIKEILLKSPKEINP